MDSGDTTQMHNYLTTPLALALAVCYLGIGTGLIPESKYVPVGQDITGINNLDQVVFMEVTNETTGQVVFVRAHDPS